MSAGDLSVALISKFESGGTDARFGVIERLAAALEVDPVTCSCLRAELAQGTPDP